MKFHGINLETKTKSELIEIINEYRRGGYKINFGQLSLFLENIGRETNVTAERRGFNLQCQFGEKIAHLHSEVSEAYEAGRYGVRPSNKIIGFEALEEEFADIFIMLCGISADYNLRLAEAIEAKMAYNRTRPNYKEERGL